MARPTKAAQIAERPDLACADGIVHVDAVREARAGLPTGARIAALAALFAALGDPTRLRIVAALAGQELCVCDLAAAVGQSQSAVSHQLPSLRALGLVGSRREGRRVYYGLDDAHVGTLYAQAMDHLDHLAELPGGSLA